MYMYTYIYTYLAADLALRRVDRRDAAALHLDPARNGGATGTL